MSSFPSTLFYNPEVDNASKRMIVDGDYVPFQFNYMTSTTQRKKPKAQLTMEVLKDSNAPRITPKTHGHFVKVEFSSDRAKATCAMSSMLLLIVLVPSFATYINHAMMMLACPWNLPLIH